MSQSLSLLLLFILLAVGVSDANSAFGGPQNVPPSAHLDKTGANGNGDDGNRAALLFGFAAHKRPAAAVDQEDNDGDNSPPIIAADETNPIGHDAVGSVDPINQKAEAVVPTGNKGENIFGDIGKPKKPNENDEAGPVAGPSATDQKALAAQIVPGEDHAAGDGGDKNAKDENADNSPSRTAAVAVGEPNPSGAEHDDDSSLS